MHSTHQVIEGAFVAEAADIPVTDHLLVTLAPVVNSDPLDQSRHDALASIYSVTAPPEESLLWGSAIN